MEPSGWFGFAPLVVLVLLAITIRIDRRDADASLREEALLSAVALGVAVIVATEILSLQRAISTGAIFVFWLAAIAAAAGVLAWRWSRVGPPARLPRVGILSGEALPAAGVATLALLTLVVAWLSPPQSSDSIGYHMSRVMHWIQNHSVAHYPTHDPPQLFEPPLAEMFRLHLQLLTGSDRAGQMLQWFAAMGSLAGVSLLARDFGGGRRAEVLAVVFAMTLPIGVAQASSGKNGWVESLWLVTLAHFALGPAADGRDWRRFAALAALGLELTTKITAWLFAPPIVVLGIVAARREGSDHRARSAAVAAGGVLVVVALAGPYLARNVALYGHPIADPVLRAKSGLEIVSPAVAVSGLVRNAITQLATPSDSVNAAIMRAVEGLHRVIGVDAYDPRTTDGLFRIRTPVLVEDRAQSPFHVLILFAVGAALAVSPRLRRDGSRLSYLAAIATAYVLYCASVKWQPSSCRLLMPLLVLAAPLAAVVADESFGGRMLRAVAALLFVLALPYAVWLSGRPLTTEPGGGILATPRRLLYSARATQYRSTYREVARTVRASGVRSLGVVFRQVGEPEYLLWNLLDDGRPRVRIEHVAVGNASGDLEHLAPFSGFRPQMVVVFAKDAASATFERELVAGGAKFTYRRAAGLAGFYVPVVSAGRS